MSEFIRKTVVVLGMHRSGTSAITNVLTAGGLYCGKEKDVLPSDPSNAKGYFERKQIMDLNERILIDHFKSSLRQFPDLNQLAETVDLKKSGWILGALTAYSDSGPLETWKQVISKTVTSIYDELNDDTSIVLKDPRFSLTLPLWRDHLRNAISIIMVRNPAEVAKSLMLREALPEFLSRQLWDIYTSSAFTVTANMPRLVIDYADLMNEPANTIDHLFDFLQQNNLSFDPENIEQAKKCIDPALYHNRTHEDQNLNNQLFENQKDVYNSVANGLLQEFPTGFEINSAIGLYRRYASSSLMLNLLDNKKNQLELKSWIREADLCQKRIDRINRHFIAGPVLNLLRFIKRDNSFGR